MKIIVSMLTLLLPKLLFANDCQLIEFPDHYEAVCLGQAKAYLTADQKSPELRSVAAPKQSSSSTGTSVAGPKSKEMAINQLSIQGAVAQPQNRDSNQTATPPAAIKTNQFAGRGTAVQRQSRQLKHAGLQEAITARNKLIAEKRQPDFTNSVPQEQVPFPD
jgi:hypothetical protein